MIKIGKYEFPSEEKYLEAKNTLPSTINPETNVAELNNDHSFVELGERTVGKYSVDVLWRDIETEPAEFKTYAITLEDNGCHSFGGIDYVDNKF